jgi:hypothetical protein
MVDYFTADFLAGFSEDFGVFDAAAGFTGADWTCSGVFSFSPAVFFAGSFFVVLFFFSGTAFSGVFSAMFPPLAYFSSAGMGSSWFFRLFHTLAPVTKQSIHDNRKWYE